MAQWRLSILRSTREAVQVIENDPYILTLVAAAEAGECP